jgi:hypothetical protein
VQTRFRILARQIEPCGENPDDHTIQPPCTPTPACFPGIPEMVSCFPGIPAMILPFQGARFGDHARKYGADIGLQYSAAASKAIAREMRFCIASIIRLRSQRADKASRRGSPHRCRYSQGFTAKVSASGHKVNLNNWTERDALKDFRSLYLIFLR